MKLCFNVSLFVGLLMLAKLLSAQEIKAYNFNELEPIFHYQNDTTYVINFWAMWCKPCVEELPEFERIRKDYSDKKVKIILVSLDFSKDVQDRLKHFLKRKKIKAEVLILNDPDANSWINKVDDKWDGALPATIIYHKNNRESFTRQVSYKELAKAIDQVSNQTN